MEIVGVSSVSQQIGAVVRVVSCIMNVFRLVLCLAGLAAYLLAKQFLPSTDVSPTLPGATLRPEATAVPVISSTSDAPSAVTLSEPQAKVLTAQPVVVGMPKPVQN